ncbi:MAG: hypothetical protein COB04_02235 [Gammaproteobacteria bacterium]|nr:MAG: hypothetical protein COB04_02235 [Gammaproteobacteria bacterium]
MKLKLCSLVILVFGFATSAAAEMADGYDMNFCGALNFQKSPTYNQHCESRGSYDSMVEELKAKGWNKALRSIWKRAIRQDRKASLSGDATQAKKSETKTLVGKFFKDPNYGFRASSRKLMMSVKMKF